MKRTTRASAAALLSIVLSPVLGSAASAQERLVVAGWDFSQYQQSGLLSITDPPSPAETLPANYSNFDPTFNAGVESADFGTHYYNGQFGSTSFTIDGSGDEPWVPSSNSLVSNLEAPLLGPGTGTNPFDSLTVLESEGQTYTQLLKMNAQGAVSVVFEADLSSVPETGSNWAVSFGGSTFSAPTMVDVEFSTNGSSYSSLGSAMLTTGDSAFELAPAGGGPASETAYFRLSFDDSGEALIDNVAITVPEPAPAASGLGAGLTLLGLRGVRRRRGAA